jgi:hypothetical protein
MSINKKRTSSEVAADAGSILSDPNASDIQKSLAASALSQRSAKRQTGKNMEEVASMVMKSNKYAEETKELAASLLSQSNRLR